MRKHMNASIRFQAPKAIKERFWALCYANGYLPSQALREAMIAMIDRLEAKQDTNTREKGGETK